MKFQLYTGSQFIWYIIQIYSIWKSSWHLKKKSQFKFKSNQVKSQFRINSKNHIHLHSQTAFHEFISQVPRNLYLTTCRGAPGVTCLDEDNEREGTVRRQHNPGRTPKGLNGENLKRFFVTEPRGFSSTTTLVFFSAPDTWQIESKVVNPILKFQHHPKSGWVLLPISGKIVLVYDRVCHMISHHNPHFSAGSLVVASNWPEQSGKPSSSQGASVDQGASEFCGQASFRSPSLWVLAQPMRGVCNMLSVFT